MTNAPTSAAAEPPIAPPTDPVGLLRFQDGAARADQVTLTISGMALPPEGSQYQAWLIRDECEQRISIGIITFDQENRSTLTFVDPEGKNLIGLYHSAEITLEPSPDNSPNPSTTVVFSAALPSGGYTHVRHLLSSFAGTPNEIGFIIGLDNTTKLISTSADQMLASFEAGELAGVRTQAETMLNVILGDQSPDTKTGMETVSSTIPAMGLDCC